MIIRAKAANSFDKPHPLNKVPIYARKSASHILKDPFGLSWKHAVAKNYSNRHTEPEEREVTGDRGSQSGFGDWFRAINYNKFAAASYAAPPLLPLPPLPRALPLIETIRNRTLFTTMMTINTMIENLKSRKVLLQEDIELTLIVTRNMYKVTTYVEPDSISLSS